ncbi:YhcN/YlaJ family sporulation lipoprotein [Oceanobacillus halophilus]|uniref:YhcN/YlaJ family sporulation lipoprotein n=1 Tax=Oceanobacillus halophilus TaxID=930130 RepID=A0A495ACK8_9BACI|nr:YhcN/YlaJ family sporulation lipoprotein [Oceanobacillus halophilus]RKQ37360.1 YhcN/YlaJ family sporulation lipoprotein [Oceanobacillus halophilus]
MRLQLSIISMLLLIIFAGCQQEEENSLESEQTNNKLIQVKNSDPSELPELTNSEIAAHLSNVATEVPDVNDAASVVAGPYTVVGIDVDKDLDRSRVGTIKYTVLEALYHDPYGKTAIVIADADITERLRNMAEKIRQGHPVQGFVNELSAIVGRYMPDFPINNNQPEQPDQNKETIPEEKEKQLEEIEENQSNRNLNKQ